MNVFIATSQESKVFLQHASPDVILCGWLGSRHQRSTECQRLGLLLPDETPSALWQTPTSYLLFETPLPSKQTSMSDLLNETPSALWQTPISYLLSETPLPSKQTTSYLLAETPSPPTQTSTLYLSAWWNTFTTPWQTSTLYLLVETPSPPEETPFTSACWNPSPP